MANNRTTRVPYEVSSMAKAMLPRQHVTSPGVIGTLLGTVATTIDLVDVFRVPANSNIKVSGASMKITTGGTGTGATTSPQWGIGNALAGTASVATNFGTAVFGTRANSTWLDFSVTETDVPAGDVIRLTSIAGTTGGASQIGGFLTIEYREDWD